MATSAYERLLVPPSASLVLEGAFPGDVGVTGAAGDLGELEEGLAEAWALAAEIFGAAMEGTTGVVVDVTV